MNHYYAVSFVNGERRLFDREKWKRLDSNTGLYLRKDDGSYTNYTFIPYTAILLFEDVTTDEFTAEEEGNV